MGVSVGVALHFFSFRLPTIVIPIFPPPPETIQKVFCALLFLSALFFALAFFVGVPMLALKPQKFALSFTCGSVTFMGSFGIMKGPYEHFMSMCTMQRMPFTTIYLGSMMATLYLTCTKGGMKGYAYVLIASGEFRSERNKL